MPSNRREGYPACQFAFALTQVVSRAFHERLKTPGNMNSLPTNFNPIMANETRSFEQKLAKIAKAGAADTPLPLDKY